jgi:hypothetical protein
MGGSYGGRAMGGSSSYGGSMGGPYRSYNAPHTTIVQPHTTVVRPSFGWGFGAPVALYSPAPVVGVGYGGGGSGIFTLLILGIFAFVAYQAVTGGFGGYALSSHV